MSEPAFVSILLYAFISSNMILRSLQEVSEYYIFLECEPKSKSIILSSIVEF